MKRVLFAVLILTATAFPQMGGVGQATGHFNQVPSDCADSSGSGTAQSCSTTNFFTPASPDCITYTTTTTSSGAGLTVNVNGLGAKSVAVAGSSGYTTTLATNIIPASKPVIMCYDGTNWDVQQTGTVQSPGSASSFTATGSLPSSTTTGLFNYGTLGFTDSDQIIAMQGSVNNYLQNILQNTSTGGSASADWIVGNNSTTSSTFYGDFGMNGTGFSGTGNLTGQASEIYVYGASGDLGLGTLTANNIHIVTDNSTVDAITVTSNGATSAGTVAVPILGSKALNVCADTSGSGTAQSCTTGQTFTVGTDSCVTYTTTTTNSGTGLTINVNSLGAKSVAIAGASGWTTTLTANIIPASKPLQACYDGTNWDITQTGTAASGGTSVNVNGSPVSSPNFNGTTPAAGTGQQNATFQVSSSSVSVEMPLPSFLGTLGAIGSGGSSQTINLNNGAVQSITLSANLTISFTQPSTTGVVRLIITQAASGGPYTITWSSVKWPAGVAPVMTSTASAVDVYSCLLDGTTTRCTAGQNFQ